LIARVATTVENALHVELVAATAIGRSVMSELAFEPMHVVAARIRARELSPVEVIEAALAQVAARGEQLNPFITLTADLALEMARAAEREVANGTYRGPLHGIPVVLKDLLQTAGVRTTGGSRVLADWVPDEDAAVVTRLHEAGAVFVGKTGMPEFAVHPTSTNPFWGAVRNPHNPRFDTGGSSSGTAAAIAAGMAWCGPGSDTGGSIRIPAAACGIVGLKPTWGRVSLRGVLPLCTLHDHVGPMARTVRDTALLLQALAGYDPDDPYARDAPVEDYSAGLEDGVAGLRVALLVDDGGGPVDSVIQRAVERGYAILASAGAMLEEVRLPFLHELVFETVTILEETETASDYERYLRERPDDLSPAFRAFATRGLERSGIEVQRARRKTLNAVHQIERALRGYDLIASPTLSTFPPPAGEELLELVRFTTPWDVNGWPSISVPTGLAANDLPIGLQLTARPWQEALVLRAARVVERGDE
jgi:aspartyl-tRNA(Asn)/glutamyl-tRNA(Gln) amidotransferase subunit A